jgi:hypothetical protein
VVPLVLDVGVLGRAVAGRLDGMAIQDSVDAKSGLGRCTTRGWSFTRRV